MWTENTLERATRMGQQVLQRTASRQVSWPAEKQHGKNPVEVTEGRKQMFYLTTHSTHFIYGYMASDIWFRTILIVKKETPCHHIGYSFRLAARVILYAPSHRQDSTYHGLCYTSREIAQWVHCMKDWSNDPSHHERTLLPRSYISLPRWLKLVYLHSPKTGFRGGWCRDQTW